VAASRPNRRDKAAEWPTLFGGLPWLPGVRDVMDSVVRFLMIVQAFKLLTDS